ncbi:MAG: NADH:flavin oxidoreductase/NADH oxidase [Chloroflexota bacterium]|nr:NADH:flavin oxidoreductase/NADH oxidase [Chloroflexota bacterium]
MSTVTLADATVRLFEPRRFRGATLRNRIVVSPMCQYSSTDGFADNWHLVHLGSRAVGGAGLVIAEATAVEARGRISPQDMGLWSDAHAEPLARIAAFVRAQGATAGLQLAHAGRKASTYRPWSGRGAVPVAEGGWTDVLALSALPYSADYPRPVAMTEEDIAAVTGAFAAAARRAAGAGFQFLEIHAAHGYLLHSFLSPLSNERTDRYGGSLENRMRFVLEVAAAVRAAWPEDLPLCARVSATDWLPDGWSVEDSVILASALRAVGVDVIAASSGGTSPAQQIAVGPGYQVPFAGRIRREAGIPTIAVGLITEPDQAEAILRDGDADLIALARGLLRDPYWPLHAATALGVEIPWPSQYERARPARAAHAGQR